MDIRPRPEECRDWAVKDSGCSKPGIIELPPYHYGIRIKRR